MTPPTAILDIDGTLVDTNYHHVQATKPKPDLVHAALDKVDDGPAIMVGDTVWDVEAAKRAKVKTIAVLTGSFSEAELREAGAADVFESIEDLRQRLPETPFG